MKDCKLCGRRIPKEWARCGECAVARERVEAEHTLEGESYRKKVVARHSALTTLSGLRPKPVKETETEEPKRSTGTRRPKETTVPRRMAISLEQRPILRILETNRIMRARGSVRKAQHRHVKTALREWMSESE